MNGQKKSRRKRPLGRVIHEAWQVGTAALVQSRPMLVHLVPMRRCNLACTYCNEYDNTSEGVPVHEMLQRVNHLADLKTAVVTISGGEPMLHPDLEEIIGHIKQRGMVCTLITNGYFLVKDRIEGLNRVGLDRLQISIDNVNPDEISKKSLKVLDKKLVSLSNLAAFEVNINSVVGGGVEHPDDALIIAQRALQLGFSATLGIIHDNSGKLQPLRGRDKEVFDQFQQLNHSGLTKFNSIFQNNLAAGKPNDWRCRAGSRFLYICEDGLVHYCSQQRGHPGIALSEYTRAQIRREHLTEKPCSPYCTISCVHQASMFDGWRSPQPHRFDLLAPQEKADLVQLGAEVL